MPSPPAATRFTLWIATGFGLGYVPRAPGTAGSLLGAALVAALWRLPPWGYAAATVGVIAAAVYCAGAAERHFGRKDHAAIVVDEVAGLAVSGWLIAPHAAALAAVFALFRLYDILKPPPVRRLERLGGGLGIVADDVAAAVYANLTLQAVLWVLHAWR
jgi:phosphatidylglycerophosphatase A